jgi:hypothetical protein
VSLKFHGVFCPRGCGSLYDLTNIPPPPRRDFGDIIDMDGVTPITGAVLICPRCEYRLLAVFKEEKECVRTGASDAETM